MKSAVRVPRRTWAIAVLGVVGCQSPPTEVGTDPAIEPAFAPPPQPTHRISFVGDRQQLYTVRDDGTGLTQVTNLSIGPYLPWYAAWAPAGPNRIAFRLLAVNDGQSLKYHVAVIGSNGAGFQDLTPVGVDAATQVRWSRDGARVAFIDYITGRLIVVNADGSGLIEIARNIGIAAPAWSPNGQRIAYFASKDEPRTLANERGIWSVKPDGTGRTKLRSTSLNHYYEDLQFSPDGDRLAMCHGPGGLEMMNANGTGLVVSLPLECSQPQWSPDGERILTRHLHDLYTVSPGGGAITQLTTNGTSLRPNWQGRWSRQGTKIAYVHPVLDRRSGTTEVTLYVMSANGSSKKRLSPIGMEANSPSWGP